MAQKSRTRRYFLFFEILKICFLFESLISGLKIDFSIVAGPVSLMLMILITVRH